MKCESLEADWIFFHPDDSGRIIHAGPSTIKWGSQYILRTFLINKVNKKTATFSNEYGVLWYFVCSVLKIKAETEFDSQYEVVFDFSIMASRENSVSLF